MGWSTEQLGDYTLVRELGEGALGTTYLAIRRGPGGFAKRFAIRLLHRYLWRDHDAHSALTDEARAGTRANHPNLVMFVDAARTPQGIPYVVMEYVSGPTLEEISRASADSPDRTRMIAAILTSVCAGLMHSHLCGVVSTVITSSDVRVTYEGVPKLMGLEASHLRDSFDDSWSPRMDRQLRYSAPELLKIGSVATAASDVFSFGVVAWEAFAGRAMFEGLTTAELMQKRITGAIPDGVDLPYGLEEALRQALSPEPEARQSVAELAGVFRKFSGGMQAHDLATWLRRMFPHEPEDLKIEDTLPEEPAPAPVIEPPPQPFAELFSIVTPPPVATRRATPAAPVPARRASPRW